MKKLILRFLASGGTIAALVAMAGCTAMPSSSGVQTLKQTQMNVSWKMIAYDAAQANASVTEAQAQNVSAAYQAYQQAFQQALTAAGGDPDVVTPWNLQAAANRVLAAVNLVLTTLT